jgi:uncharacterized protein
MLRLLAVLSLATVVACGTEPSAPPVPTAPPGGALVAFGKNVAAVELATDAASWQKGLMRRRSLDPDSGMLFLFPEEQKSGFWMKNTLIPLSIAFMKRTRGQTYRVVRILDMTPCKADPCRIYDPKAAYDVALEVNRGWFTAHAVREGSIGRVGRASSTED